MKELSQSADRTWCIRAPFSSFELESALVHLPSRVLLNFNRLEPAMNRGDDLWAVRLGTAEMDEADLAQDWVPAPHPQVSFSEPVREGDDGSGVPSTRTGLVQ